MAFYYDKTTSDIRRRNINLQRADVESVLPEHFIEQYPKLISLFKAYYEFIEEEDQPGNRINELYKNRDISQVDADLLQFIEDELLLGQAYFGGFINKREAAKFSNILYRSKGTRYSIQQFFRAFFGTDPEVVYPKENIFRVGPIVDRSSNNNNETGLQILEPASVIGAESQRYLTDDKLYQTLAVLIKSDIPINVWREVYKLFVHPAGMYLGGQIVISSSNNNPVDTLMPEVAAADALANAITIAGEALGGIGNNMPPASVTGLIDSDGNTLRTDLITQIANIGNLTFEEFEDRYGGIDESISPSKPTMDDSTGDSGSVRFSDSTGNETFDQSWFDSIGTF